MQAIRSTSVVERPAAAEESEVKVMIKPIRKRESKAVGKQEGVVPPVLTKEELKKQQVMKQASDGTLILQAHKPRATPTQCI